MKTFKADGVHRRVQVSAGQYATQGSHEGIAACREAIAHLLKQPVVSPLQYSAVLERSATDHVLDQGSGGYTGHAGSNGSHPQDRIERYGDVVTTMGEVCSYSQDTDGLQIIMKFVIDDGVADRGHRDAVFDADFGVCGVGVGQSNTHSIKSKWCNIWIRDVFWSQHFGCRGQNTSQIQH